MKRDAYTYERGPTVVRKVKENGKEIEVETPRKGWTEGTKWRAIVPAGPDSPRREFYGPTEAAANEKVGAWRRRGGHTGEVRRGGRRYAPKVQPVLKGGVGKAPTAAKWFEDWAKKGRPGDWDERRYKDVRWLVEKHIKPHWQRLAIDEVTQEAVAGLLAKLDTRPTTQDNLRRMLRTAFKDCEWVEGDLVPSLVRAEQKKKKQQQGRPDGFRVLIPWEWKALVAECLASTDPVASAILLTLQCGLRSSETRGLHWYDYDDGQDQSDDPNRPQLTPAEILAELQDTNAEDDEEEYVGATIFVHQAVIRTDKERKATSLMLSDSTKTIHGERKLPVPLASQEALRRHRLRKIHLHRSEEDKAAGEFWIGPDTIEGRAPKITDLIWPALGRSGDPDHKRRTRPLDSSRLNRVLDVLRSAAGIARYACPNGHGNGDGSCPTCERPMMSGDARGLRPSETAKRPRRGEKCTTCAGVAPPVCGKCNRQLASLRVHDLRHSYCTVLLAERKVSPADICVRMGWSPTPASMSAMLARYAHSTVAGKAAADEAVETMTGNIDELMAQRTARLAPRQGNGTGNPNEDN